MFNQTEQDIINYGVKNGKSQQDVTAALTNYRLGIQPKKENSTQTPTEQPSYLQSLGNHLVKNAEDANNTLNMALTPPEAPKAGETALEVGARVGRKALQAPEAALRIVGGAVDSIFSPITELPLVKGAVGEVAQQVMKIRGVPELVKYGAGLAKQHPELAKDIQNIIDIATLGSGGAAEKPIAEGVAKVGSKVASSAENIATKVAETATKIGDSELGKVGEGLVQTTKDLGEAIGRGVGKGKDALIKNGEKAAILKESAPEVQQAIKANLDQRMINTIAEADKPTKQAYKDVLSIAEESPKKIGMKKQPSIVSGDLASQQYDIIAKEKQNIGKQIGDATKDLSKTKKVAMQDSYNEIKKTLADTGIVPVIDEEKGVHLDFTGSKYTPAERTKITELYNLATEGGNKLSPLQIRGKDQLFSKLQREARFDGIGDLIIDTADGPKSMFSIFRDIYSSKLDSISPQIKKLNTQYKQYANLTDDIENSIFKTPNFQATKSVDPAEFAKVNLRRIFGESQSSPAFEAVANAMDAASRGLGYKGASPKNVAEFAQEIRKLFPETIPATGFQGGIKTGVKGAAMDIINKAIDAGMPNLKDQQKALRGLLEAKTLKLLKN